MENINDQIRREIKRSKEITEAVVKLGNSVFVGEVNSFEYHPETMLLNLSGADCRIISEPEDQDLTILHFKANKDIYIPPHYHNKNEYVLLISGTCVLNDDIVAKKDKTVFFRKGEVHSAHFLKDTEILVIYLPAIDLIEVKENVQE